MTNEVRVKAGEKPPDTIEHDGKRYRPTWMEVTIQSDRNAGEQVFMVAAMGEPLEDDDEEEKA